MDTHAWDKMLIETCTVKVSCLKTIAIISFTDRYILHTLRNKLREVANLPCMATNSETGYHVLLQVQGGCHIRL